ncbi:MAG: transporter permease [Bacteroidetes bacterium]|jgi:ABC-2 type transport system permease protein|nr:transporter permease [Bacteroidota bacterium]MDF2450887.1 transporter permease [Bacteroidota bacterium]
MKLIYSLYKEYKVLIRDRAGLAITFIMPTALILIMTLIQDSTFKSVNESAVPLLFVDRDHDSLSQTLEKYINHSKFFTITKKQLSNNEVKKQVAQGNFLIGIIIPENTSKRLKERSTERITNLLNSFSGDSIETLSTDTSKIQLNIFFDPVTKQSFKTTISGAIDRIISQIEMQGMINALNAKMKETFPDSKPSALESTPLVNISEEYASYNNSVIIPNAVQHNVPAWTLFAMFFICIPLAGNIIKERQDGSAFRLLTMPGSYFIVMLGKLLTYTLVSLIQFLLMLCVGVFILPLLGMPQLNIGDNLPLLFLIALSAGLAATGFGLLVGTIATSHDQASLFGAVFVIILAAIGGVWVPTFVMPDFMKTISVFSPLNWGLESFYAVFIRNSSLKEIWPEILKLWVFFIATLSSAFLYQKYKRLN